MIFRFGFKFEFVTDLNLKKYKFEKKTQICGSEISDLSLILKLRFANLSFKSEFQI